MLRKRQKPKKNEENKILFSSEEAGDGVEFDFQTALAKAALSGDTLEIDPASFKNLTDHKLEILKDSEVDFTVTGVEGIGPDAISGIIAARNLKRATRKQGPSHNRAMPSKATPNSVESRKERAKKRAEVYIVPLLNFVEEKTGEKLSGAVDLKKAFEEPNITSYGAAKYLRENKIQTPEGGTFQPNTVDRILKHLDLGDLD